jgi:F-box and WD-40 domain protein 1/11
VRLWNVDSGKFIHAYRPPLANINAVRFSRDGTHVLVAGQDRAVQLWDAVTGNHVRNLEAMQSVVTSLAQSLDGTHLLGGTFAAITESQLYPKTGQMYLDKRAGCPRGLLRLPRLPYHRMALVLPLLVVSALFSR